VKKILTNYTYTGNLIQRKNQISAVNIHEPIITEEVFDDIQTRFSATESCRRVKKTDNPLRSKVICEQCGGKMQRKRGFGKADWFFFTCITKNRRGVEYCDGAYIHEADILLAIWQELQAMQAKYLTSITQCEENISKLKESLQNLTNIEKMQMSKHQETYERYITGQYTTQEYKETVNELPFPMLQIDQLYAYLERLEEIKRYCISEYWRFVARIRLIPF